MSFALRYVGGIVCLAVPVPSLRVWNVGPGASLSYHFFDNISVVAFFLVFVGLPVQSKLFFIGLFFVVGRVSVATAL